MPNLPKQHKAHGRAKRHTTTNQRRARRKYPTNHRTWIRMRTHQLTKHPYCADPYNRHNGQKVEATHVDHIDGNSWNNHPSNHQSLCHSCHSVKTAKQDGGFGNPHRR